MARRLTGKARAGRQRVVAARKHLVRRAAAKRPVVEAVLKAVDESDAKAALEAKVSEIEETVEQAKEEVAKTVAKAAQEVVDAAKPRMGEHTGEEEE